MNSLRRWLYKPKKSDRSLLAQFYYADEELNMVAAELDSFDGHKDPERCTLLVNQLRGCQDKVLNIIQKIMDKAIDVDRANRDFRVKFPDDVLQESLAGQLWFGAECLAAGSTIMNREVESASMRPLARALTKNLDSLRSILREQCLKNINVYTERIKEALTIFDKLFAEFELSYVSAMVPVKTMKEYDILQEVTVLFSETVHRSLKLGLLTQEMIDDYDPALMFTIPRLAIVCGLLVYPEGPLNPDMETSNMSEMFRPFQPLLYKIRELLYTLSRDELFTLEKALCSADEPEIDLSSSLIHQSDIDSQSQVSCQTEKVASMDARFLTISPLTPALYQDSAACQEDILVHSPSSGSPVTPDSEGEFSIGQMSHSPSVVTIILKGSPASDHRTVESVEISSLNKCASKDSGFSSENIGSSGSLSNPVSSCDDDDHHSSADCAMDTSSNSSSNSSTSSNTNNNNNNNNNIPNDRVGAAQASCGAELCDTASLPVNPSYPSPSQLQQESHSLSYQHPYPSSPSSTPSPKQVRHKQEACESPNTSTDILTTQHDLTDRLVSQNLTLPSFMPPSSSLSPQLPSTMDIPPAMTQSWQYDIQFEIPRISIQPSSSVEDIDAIHDVGLQQKQQPQQDVQQNSSSSPPSLSQQPQQQQQQQQQQQSNHKQQVHSAHNPSHDHLLQECAESAATIRPSSHYLGSCRRSTEATSHAGGDLIKNKRKVCHSNRVTEPDCKGTLKFSTAMNACALEKFQHKAGNPYRRGSVGGGGGSSVSHGAMLPDDSEACLEIPRIQRLRYTESISSTCSSCRSGCSVGSDCEWDRESCASSETSSYNSDCHDDEEIALAIQAAELASRNEARSRFQNSSDLIHRLFVCISGVADQLQTNFASDLRSILKAVFDINCSEPLVMADNAIESGSQLYTASSSHAMGSVGVPHHIAASGSTGSPSPPLLARSASSDDDQHLEQYARSRSFQEPPPWVPDEQCPHCSSCKAPFTFVKRRHHCRNCGKVFCSRCSANSVPLPQYGHVKPVRVCNHCFVFQVTHFTVQEE
ncbi:lateral signaling target protein 2 homolog [Octopus sinensis]|uniref:Lateral signaling target protein 2 homolog n=1 Tax=Octopus sinensis TaxID=2607531 RepID=A0A6P7T422_9MOLL|nr:lateral signaling target protein 2 homolog [Octopus sinensis]